MNISDEIATRQATEDSLHVQLQKERDSASRLHAELRDARKDLESERETLNSVREQLRGFFF